MNIQSSKAKRWKRRKESKVLHMVRMHDVARDGDCRIAQDWIADDEAHLDGRWLCEGESQLMHLEGDRRFKTRGRAAELRHTTAGTCMGCAKHHAMYDARIIRVEMLSTAGTDGEMRWRFVR